jgi:hypothetical protein
MKTFKRDKALGFWNNNLRLSKMNKLGDSREKASKGIDFEKFRTLLEFRDTSFVKTPRQHNKSAENGQTKERKNNDLRKKIKQTTSTYLKNILTTILLTVLTQIVFGTTWTAAYPYTQQIDGQNVIVKAFPYAPYSGSPMIGVTKVYLNNTLLYSIDKYYRERIVTSNDGQYLAVIHTSNSAGIASYTSFGINRINFDRTAIEIFKNGQPFKKFTLKDVIDTAVLANNGLFFYWGYYVDFKAFDNAIQNYRFWNKNLSRSEKRECLNGDTTSYCKEWINGRDSMKIFKQEKHIYTNSVYIKDNSLFVLTNQNMAVKLDLSTLTIQQIPLEEIVTDVKTFNPPKLNRKYKKIKLPDKFDEPKIKDGRSFEKGLADLFNLTVHNSDGETFCIFINKLFLDKKGKCIDFYGNVYDRRISESFTNESINKEMTEILNKWIKEQIFDTKLIPKGFDGYSFLCIVNLK